MSNDARRRTPVGGFQDIDERLAALESRLYNPDPIGSMRLFAAGAPNARWLPADGAAVSRTEYAALFSRIGTTHGVGDGSTTFNVPNAADVGGVPYYIKS
jgi:hypothetical protein